LLNVRRSVTIKLTNHWRKPLEQKVGQLSLNGKDFFVVAEKTKQSYLIIWVYFAGSSEQAKDYIYDVYTTLTSTTGPKLAMYGATVESLSQTRTEVMENGRLHFVVTASEPASSDITIRIDLKTTFGVFDAPATSSGIFGASAATNPACIDILFGAPFAGAKPVGGQFSAGIGGQTLEQILAQKSGGMKRPKTSRPAQVGLYGSNPGQQQVAFGQVVGTTVKFKPSEGKDEMMAFGVLQDINTRHQVIII
jgi:hypothetical protein